MVPIFLFVLADLVQNGKAKSKPISPRRLMQSTELKMDIIEMQPVRQVRNRVICNSEWSLDTMPMGHLNS